MSEELKVYLTSSKENRQKLKKLAKNIQNSNLKIPKLEEAPKKDFPELNPKKFKDFEAELNDEHKKIFIDGSLSCKAQRKVDNKLRSVSFHKKRIASIYNLLNVKVKKPSFLPPIVRNRERSVPERLLAGKYMTSGSDLDSMNTLKLGAKIGKRSKATRFDVKKMLLQPVLTKKYEELSSNRKSDSSIMKT